MIWKTLELYTTQSFPSLQRNKCRIRSGSRLLRSPDIISTAAWQDSSLSQWPEMEAGELGGQKHSVTCGSISVRPPSSDQLSSEISGIVVHSAFWVVCIWKGSRFSWPWILVPEQPNASSVPDDDVSLDEGDLALAKATSNRLGENEEGSEDGVRGGEGKSGVVPDGPEPGCSLTLCA